MENLKNIGKICDLIISFNGKFLINLGENMVKTMESATPGDLRYYLTYSAINNLFVINTSKVYVARKLIYGNKSISAEKITKLNEQINKLLTEMLGHIESMIEILGKFRENKTMRIPEAIEMYRESLGKIRAELKLGKLNAIETTTPGGDVEKLSTMKEYKIIIGGFEIVGGASNGIVSDMIDYCDDPGSVQAISELFESGHAFNSLAHNVSKNLLKMTRIFIADVIPGVVAYQQSRDPGYRFAIGENSVIPKIPGYISEYFNISTNNIISDVLQPCLNSLNKILSDIDNYDTAKIANLIASGNLHDVTPAKHPESRGMLKSQVSDALNTITKLASQISGVLAQHREIYDFGKLTATNSKKNKKYMSRVKSAFKKLQPDLMTIEELSDQIADQMDKIKNTLDTMKSPGFKDSCIKRIAFHIKNNSPGDTTPESIRKYSGTFLARNAPGARDPADGHNPG